jgi:drug/metabolite transporter (DMT)-like permease
MKTNLITANTIGFLSIVLWAIGSNVYPFLTRIPNFQILTVCMLIAGFLALLNIAWKNEWHQLDQSWQHWVLGLIGINFTNICYISSFHYAPAAKVQLLGYLWPVMVVLFSMKFIAKKQLSQYLLAAFFGILAIFLIYQVDHQPMPIGNKPLLGYSFAIMGAVFWSSYIVAKHHLGETPVAFLGICMGVGALVMLIAFPMWGPWVAPTFKEWLLMLYAGVFSFFIAFTCWDYGATRGDYQLLSIMAYISPVFTVLLMALLGKATLTLSILLACGFVIAAALIAARASKFNPS